MKEFLASEEYRRDLYKLLSECFYPPDEGLVEILERLDKSRGGLYLEIAKALPRTIDIELLKIDYSKLFLGPYGLLAPPYGSMYLEDVRRVMGNSTIDAKIRYEAEGLEIGLKETPDHIAIELEFMYFLIFKEIEAARNSDNAQALNFINKQEAFLKTHLGMWVSEFGERVEENAQTDFYKVLGRITRAFVCEDRDTISDGKDIVSNNDAPARVNVS